MTYSASRAEHSEVLDAVDEDRDQALDETAYLLRSPANARRLLASIDQLEHGGGTPRELVADG